MFKPTVHTVFVIYHHTHAMIPSFFRSPSGVQGEGLTAKELAKQEGFLEAAELIPDVVEQEL